VFFNYCFIVLGVSALIFMDTKRIHIFFWSTVCTVSGTTDARGSDVLWRRRRDHRVTEIILPRLPATTTRVRWHRASVPKSLPTACAETLAPLLATASNFAPARSPKLRINNALGQRHFRSKDHVQASLPDFFSTKNRQQHEKRSPKCAPTKFPETPMFSTGSSFKRQPHWRSFAQSGNPCCPLIHVYQNVCNKVIVRVIVKRQFLPLRDILYIGNNRGTVKRQLRTPQPT